jgi:Mg2+ and Co2+ transporter CorA
VDLDSATREESRILADVFHFHELAIEDAMSEAHHPKVESYGEYLYLILHGIDFAAAEHRFTTKDVDFFLGAQFLVTVHPGVSRTLGRINELCDRDNRLLGEGPGILMYRIIDMMIDNYQPEVEKLEAQLDEIEDEVVRAPQPEALPPDPQLQEGRLVAAPGRAAAARRRRPARAPRIPADQRVAGVPFPGRPRSSRPAVRRSDVLQDRITSILDAHLSAVSNQLNSVMKVLTIIATIFMPLTFITGLYGMNVDLPHFGLGRHHHVLGADGRHGRERRRHAVVLPQARLDLAPWAGSTASLPTSPIKSPPAKSSNVPPPSSRSWSRTRSTPGARRISIAVELGGKKLIRVEDDGEGMDPDDARLAIERHATSKIAHAQDLGAIDTLGFRGEALPSIASVSHFTLRTRLRGLQGGPRSRSTPARSRRSATWRAGRGTCIEVADLFYNLPARRKFLKSDTAETTQISRLATQLALG